MAREAVAPLRVAVLASGSGSNLRALLEDQQGYRIVVVICDRPGAGALLHAERAGVAALCLPLRSPRDLALRAAWEQEVATNLASHAPDLIVMAGWMRVMSEGFVNQFRDRIINQHPALLPEDNAPDYQLADGSRIPAIRGAHAVRDALRLGITRTGCTVHWVTPDVDVGPVLARAEVPVLPDDDEQTLHERIKGHERRLIVDVVRRLAGSC
jgi:phosphoribosylglycinamide formyltransferase-1